MREAQEAFLSLGVASQESARIFADIEKDPRFISAGCVLLYMSIPGEVQTAAFIDKWYKKKRLVLPKVCGGSLVLFEYNPNHIKEGYRGILEPTLNADPISDEQIDLVIVPGVAFSKEPDGRVLRLGRGGGYYDKLLPRLSCPMFGVGYPFRLLDSVPCDPWDISLDALFV